MALCPHFSPHAVARTHAPPPQRRIVAPGGKKPPAEKDRRERASQRAAEAGARAELRAFELSLGHRPSAMQVAQYVLDRVRSFAAGDSRIVPKRLTHDSDALALRMGLVTTKGAVRHEACRTLFGVYAVDRGTGPKAPRTARPAPAPSRLPLAEKAELDRRMGLTPTGTTLSPQTNLRGDVT